MLSFLRSCLAVFLSISLLVQESGAFSRHPDQRVNPQANPSVFAAQTLVSRAVGAHRYAVDAPATIRVYEILAQDRRYIGGLERWVGDLVASVRSHRPIDFQFVYGKFDEPLLPSHTHLEGEIDHVFPRRRGMVWAGFHSLYHVQRILGPLIQRDRREGKASLLHFHAPYSWGLLMGLRYASWRWRVPLILTVHQSRFSLSRGWFIDAAACRVIPWLSWGVTLTTVSRAAMRYFRQAPALITRAVDHRFFDPQLASPDTFRQRYAAFGVSADALLVLDPSRITPDKGIMDLMVLARKIRDQSLHAQVIVMGPIQHNAYFQSLLDEVATQNLGLYFRFLPPGNPSELRDAYAASALVISPTRTEALGNIFLEGAAMGIPSVSYAVGGVPEAVLSGETGVLVREGDRESLADAALMLLHDHELRRNMGQAAAQRVRTTFTWSRHARVWTELLEGLAHDHSAFPTQKASRAGLLKYALGWGAMSLTFQALEKLMAVQMSWMSLLSTWIFFSLLWLALGIPDGGPVAETARGRTGWAYSYRKIMNPFAQAFVDAEEAFHRVTTRLVPGLSERDVFRRRTFTGKVVALLRSLDEVFAKTFALVSFPVLYVWRASRHYQARSSWVYRNKVFFMLQQAGAIVMTAGWILRLPTPVGVIDRIIWLAVVVIGYFIVRIVISMFAATVRSALSPKAEESFVALKQMATLYASFHAHASRGFLEGNDQLLAGFVYQAERAVRERSAYSLKLALIQIEAWVHHDSADYPYLHGVRLIGLWPVAERRCLERWMKVDEALAAEVWNDLHNLLYRPIRPPHPLTQAA